MASVNIIILGGNLTRDPEMRFTPSGTAVAEFGVAVNRKWRDAAGELKEEVSFFDCAAFGKTAETIQQYLGKGKPILIQGRLKLEQWDDRETGRKRSKVKVIVESFNFIGAAVQGERQAPARTAAKPQASDNDGENVPAGPASEEDNVPF
jgi:single-strand DNA-binding protein